MEQLKRYISLLLSLSIVFSILSCGDADKEKSVEDLPNIIIILADDLGYGDLGCYGHPYAKTPNIDNLAKEGILFKRFYASGMTCCPSRTALMTGKHPATYKKYMAENGFGNNVTITELLKNAGYATAHIGKWHIGPYYEADKNPYGIDLINVMKANRDSLIGKDADIFDCAIDFIKKNNNRPFYINLWTHTNHFPLNPSENMLMHFEGLEVDENQFGRWFNQDKLQILKQNGRNIDDAMKMYLADVYSLDLNIGRLMQCLKEQNLEQNTIIIFSSDQGPAPVYNDKKIESIETKEQMLNMLGYAGGYRGGKHTQYEGGVRVPF
ncbi:MAG: sulfatase-like hydrolase/transferase, partial [Bacteroidales bacterium]|nr:sulfatase-like hydrolase/transferase [Bacteroidales bacterium]